MNHEATAAVGTRQRTRRAILDAMVDVIMEADGIGFSVQAVADRAGVTHRTIYNHFPTREALCDAFSDYVDGLLEASSGARAPTWSLASLPQLAEDLYRTLALRDRHARAYVMLMIGNRRPMSAWRHRSLMAEKLIAREQSGRTPLTPRQLTAVIRLFVSTMGWHLLTEQCGLSTNEAAAASAWATRTLLDAAIGKPGPAKAGRHVSPSPRAGRQVSPAPRAGRQVSPAPRAGRQVSPAPRAGRHVSSSPSKGGANATRRRRN
jgi:AcrR family transcriptional regulator